MLGTKPTAQGEHPEGEQSPGEHRASVRLKYANPEQRIHSRTKALQSSVVFSPENTRPTARGHESAW